MDRLGQIIGTSESTGVATRIRREYLRTFGIWIIEPPALRRRLLLERHTTTLPAVRPTQAKAQRGKSICAAPGRFRNEFSRQGKRRERTTGYRKAIIRPLFQPRSDEPVIFIGCWFGRWIVCSVFHIDRNAAVTDQASELNVVKDL